MFTQNQFSIKLILFFFFVCVDLTQNRITKENWNIQQIFMIVFYTSYKLYNFKNILTLLELFIDILDFQCFLVFFYKC